MDWCENGPCVFPSSVIAGLLAAAIDTDGPFETVKVALFTNNIVPAPTSLLTDFTLATFTGSTPAAITWGDVYSDGNGNAIAPGGSHLFTVTGTVSETVYGYIITNAGGSTLLAARQFPVAQQAVPGGPPIQAWVELMLLNATGIPMLA